jgi:DNA-binding winged helix-turn-helix (wHTH) protein
MSSAASRFLGVALVVGRLPMRLTFGEFVFDRDTREVIRSGRPLTISPKAFTLLDLLIESRPGAISRGDIHSWLWPGTHVSEQNLGNLVVELRAALGEDARQPRIIRTVARFGYAFSANAVVGGGREERARGLDGLAYRLAWGRHEISLSAGENLIGRDREAVVWIDDESVSRRHARISIGDGGVSIEDLGSKNGTYVGGRRLKEPVPIRDRDVVKIGPASLTLKRTGPTRSAVREPSS